MAYIAPIHRASGVRHALKLKLIDPEEDCLVVTKCNRIEVYVQSPEGLILYHTKAIHGQILFLEKIHPETSMTDHLFVCTDRYGYFTASWNAVDKQLQTEQSFVDIGDNNARDSHSYDRCFIDTRRRFLTLGLYEGIYSVLKAHYKQPSKTQKQLELGSLADEVIPVRVGEILIRSSTYLHYRTESEKEWPRIVTLYQDTHDRAWLKVRTLTPNQEGFNLEDEKFLLSDRLDPTSTHLIPVSNPINGVLILSETCITWVNTDEASKIQKLDEATIWSTWARVEEKEDDLRWLLADEYGNLYFLMIEYDADLQELYGFKLDKIGHTSKASVLVYLSAGFVFVGSHSGDSQLIHITNEGLRIAQTFSNIGPIVDMAVMDMGNRGTESQVNEFSSGQARLVTGSGAFEDGSLRSIRSGVGVEEIGSLELNPDGTGLARAATNIFHIPILASEGISDLLLVSYVDETRIFNFAEDGTVEEVQQMVTNEPTILAARIVGSVPRLIQCTSNSVTIYAIEDTRLKLKDHWKAPTGSSIVAASFSDQCAVVSVGGTELITLDISDTHPSSGQIPEISKRKFDDFISCIEIPNISPNLLIVGFWQNASLSVLNLSDLKDLYTAEISNDLNAVPRSVLLTQVLPDHLPTLFISLADGHVVTFDVDISTFSLSNRQTTLLDSQHANLKILPRSNRLYSVFAIAKHSTLIYGAEGRLVYSAVNSDEATCICSFNTVTYPDAVILATPSELKIVMVERERTTHVQSLHIGETVRRIAYSPELRAFGMGTIKRELVEGNELVTSSFKLVDEIAFETLAEYSMNKDEIVESAKRMHLMEDGKSVERFVVGTSYLDDFDDVEHPRGRILVLQVTQDKAWKLVTEQKVKGACRALATIDGKIVAGLVKTLTIYAYEYSGLQRKASYRCATAPIDIYAEGDKIIVSDLMKSVALIKYTRGLAGAPDKLEESARHFQTCWSTAVGPVDGEKVVEADAEGNVLLLALNTSIRMHGEKARLETISEMNIGEMINKIRPITIPPTSSAIVVPRAFLASVNGGIYMLGQIRSDMQNELMELQSTVSEHVTSLGDLQWASWRACKTTVREEKEPLRFVDGDLVEAFLDCSPDVQEEIAKKLSTNVPKITGIVETLRRMH